MPEPTTWEEWVAQTPDDAAMAELSAAYEEADRCEQEADAAWRAARRATHAAANARDYGSKMRGMARAAQGYDHIHLHPRAGHQFPALFGRRDGLPYVYVHGRGWEAARSRDHVGPGPAVKGRVPGGRRWYALEDLPPWKRVAEWRLAEVPHAE